MMDMNYTGWGGWREYRRYLAEDGEHVIRLYERYDHTGRRFTKNDRVRVKHAPHDGAQHEEAPAA
jgi:hypothetical protein